MPEKFCAGGGTQVCGYATISDGSKPNGCGYSGNCDFQRPRTMDVKW